MRLCIEIYKELKVGVVMWQQTKCPRVELSANFTLRKANALQLLYASTFRSYSYALRSTLLLVVFTVGSTMVVFTVVHGAGAARGPDVVRLAVVRAPAA